MSPPRSVGIVDAVVASLASYLPFFSSLYVASNFANLLVKSNQGVQLDVRSGVSDDIDSYIRSSLGLFLTTWLAVCGVFILITANYSLFFLKHAKSKFSQSFVWLLCLDFVFLYVVSGASLFGLAMTFHSRCFLMTWIITWVLHYLVPNELALPALYRHQFSNIILFVVYQLLHQYVHLLPTYVEALLHTGCYAVLFLYATAYFQWKKFFHSMADCICGPQWLLLCVLLGASYPLEMVGVFGGRMFLSGVLNAIVGRVIILALLCWVLSCVVTVRSLGFSLCDVVLPLYVYVFLMSNNLPERVALVLFTAHLIHFGHLVKDLQESYLTGYIDKPDRGQKYDLPKYALSVLNYITLVYVVAEVLFHLNYVVKFAAVPLQSLMYMPFSDLCLSCGQHAIAYQIFGFMVICTVFVVTLFCEFQCHHQNMVDRSDPMSPKSCRNTHQAHSVCGECLDFVFPIIMKLLVLGFIASLVGAGLFAEDHRMMTFELSCVGVCLLAGYVIRMHSKEDESLWNGPVDLVESHKVHMAGCSCGKDGGKALSELAQTVRQVTVLTTIKPPKTYKGSFALGVVLSCLWLLIWVTVLSRKSAAFYPHVNLLPQIEASMFGVPWGKYWKTNTALIPDLVAAVVYASQFWLNPLLGVWSFYTIFKQMWAHFRGQEGDPMFEQKMRKAGAYWVGFGFLNMLSSVTQFLLPCAPPWFVDDVYTPGFREFFGQRGNAAGLLRVDAFMGVKFFENIYAASPVVFGAFPSTHCAYPLLLLFFPTQRFKAIRLAYAIVMVWASVYLQHHYVIDGMGGYLYAYLSFRIFIYPLSRKPEDVVRVRANSMECIDLDGDDGENAINSTPHELNHRSWSKSMHLNNPENFSPFFSSMATPVSAHFPTLNSGSAFVV